MSRRTKRQLARIHAKVISSFPEPPETFTLQDIDALEHSQVNRFRVHGVINVVGTVPPHNEDSQNIYVADGPSHEIACRCFDTKDRLSCCGATGVTNVGGDLVCKDCGAVIGEAEFRQVCRI